MSPSTTEVQNASTRQLMWLAGAVGAVVGIASLAYKRRERSRWDKTKERARQFVKNATEEVRPWMGVAAGTAAAGATIAVYARGRKKSNWQRTRSRAGEVVSQAGQELRPWAGLAASAAISLVSAVYSQRRRTKVKNAMRAGARESVDNLANVGVRLLRRVRDISEKTGRLYPKMRKLIA
jgi:hypothetical protein